MRTRKHNQYVRLNDDEWSKLSALSCSAGISKEQTIRSLIIGEPIRPQRTNQYRELAQQISIIGNNINQVVRLANTTNSISSTMVEHLIEEQRRLWNLFYERL